MINARTFVISALAAVLSAAPLICAQDVKPPEPTVALQPPLIQELGLQPPRSLLAFSLPTDPAFAPLTATPDLSRYQEFPFGMDLLAVAKQAEMQPSEAKVIHQRPAVIQELEWRPQRSLAFSLQADPVFAPLTATPDLSRYRDFRFGMDLLAVAKQAEMQPSEARVIHQRPAVIQELEWRPQRSFAYSPQGDPVQEVLFSFYNGELFRIVVTYDQIKTEGLTDEDMVEAISAKYGTATRPAAKVILFSSSQVYNDSENVIARWQDSQYSFNLFRSSYQPTFGMLVFSKRLDLLAQAAIVEAIRLDEQEAPQRETELQKQQDEENRAGQAKARLVNKPTFRL